MKKQSTYSTLPLPSAQKPLVINVRLAMSKMPRRWQSSIPSFVSVLQGKDCLRAHTEDVDVDSSIMPMSLLSRSLSCDEINDDSWLSSSVIDLILSKFAREYRDCHFMPIEFAAFRLKTMQTLDMLQATDILGNVIDYRQQKPVIFLAHVSGMHWNLLRVQHWPTKELQLFEPMGKPASRHGKETRAISLRYIPKHIIHWLDTCWPLIHHGSEQEYFHWSSPSLSSSSSSSSSSSNRSIQPVVIDADDVQSCIVIEDKPVVSQRLTRSSSRSSSGTSSSKTFSSSLLSDLEDEEEEEGVIIIGTDSKSSEFASFSNLNESSMRPKLRRKSVLGNNRSIYKNKSLSTNLCKIEANDHFEEEKNTSSSVYDVSLQRKQKRSMRDIHILEEHNVQGLKDMEHEELELRKQDIEKRCAENELGISWQTKTISAITTQHQSTGFDCGVACLLYAEKCAQGMMREDINDTTSQHDITEFRKYLQQCTRGIGSF